MYKSIEEAQNARLELLASIQSIDVQLAERKTAAEVASDAQYEAYLEWRPMAIKAKNALTIRLQQTKLWMVRKRRDDAQRRAAHGEHALIQELYGLAKTLVAAGAEIRPEEQQLLDDVAVYLESPVKEVK